MAADELTAFISLGSPEHAAEQAAYVTDLFERGAMRPDWCFLAEEGGEPVGRFAFWTLPGQAAPLSLVLVDVGSDVPPSARAGVASVMLADAVARARGVGSKRLGQVVDEPTQWPQWQRDLESLPEWLEAAGLTVTRTTTRWELAPGLSPPPTKRLTFRSLPEVGEEAFIDAIARVSAASFDQQTREARDRLGPGGEARDTFNDLSDMLFEPSWWELAVDIDDNLVGLVMPTKAPSIVSIGYIGVVPEQRGRGYVNDLLGRGTATLLRIADGLAIRADTDVANTPMAAAFERAGWRQFATRREFEIRL